MLFKYLELEVQMEIVGRLYIKCNIEKVLSVDNIHRKPLHT